MRNLSRLRRLVSVACQHSTGYTWSALDRIMSTGNIQQSPKKISKSSTTAYISCCRLCKSVEDVSCSKNIYRALLAPAEEIYGRPLRRDKLPPHLLCRPCERRLKNSISF